MSDSFDSTYSTGLIGDIFDKVVDHIHDNYRDEDDEQVDTEYISDRLDSVLLEVDPTAPVRSGLEACVIGCQELTSAGFITTEKYVELVFQCEERWNKIYKKEYIAVEAKEMLIGNKD